ncbi:hypothetical protein SUGI_0301450 [Cryptomeria japonica]|nr:hypothetical protein SUGI_0301450 [Cryptomeria japonica]
MAQTQEGASLSRAPLFDGTDYVFWKIRMETYLISVDLNVWNIVTTKYTVPSIIPTGPDDKTKYELNVRAKHALLCGLTKDVFVKVMHCSSAYDIWKKLETIYQGDAKVKESKIITLKNQFESLRMKEDETVASYFLRVDEIVNSRKGLGEEVEEKEVVNKVIRTLLPKFETKVSTLEEKKSFSTMTLDNLQSILTAYEMRIGNNPSSSKETAFKVEKKEELDSESELSDAIEALFVRKLKKKYKGKLPFKCFNCGKAGHFAAQCPLSDQNSEEEKPEKFYKKKMWNPKRRFNTFKKKKSLFTKEDSGNESDDSPCEGDETLFMAKLEDVTSKTKNEFEDLDQGEIDLEGELLCALKEIKRLKKLVASHENSNQILQVELNDANLVISNLKCLLEEREKKIETLEQQSTKLQKQIERYESTIHLNDILSKQKLHKDLASLGFDKAESSRQNTKPATRKSFQPYNRTKPFRFGFFHGYCFYCNRFGHKVNTCRFLQQKISYVCLQSRI